MRWCEPKAPDDPEAARHSLALQNALWRSGVEHQRMLNAVALCRDMLDRQVPCGTWRYTALVHFAKWHQHWFDTKETRELFFEYVKRGLIHLNEPIVGVPHRSGLSEGELPLEVALKSNGAFFAFLDAGADLRLIPGPHYSKDANIGDIFDLVHRALREAPAFAARLTDYLMQRQLREQVGTPNPPDDQAPRRRRHSL